MSDHPEIHLAYAELLLHDLLRVHKQTQSLADTGRHIEAAKAATRLSMCVQDIIALTERLAPPTPETIALRDACSALITFATAGDTPP